MAKAELNEVQQARFDSCWAVYRKKAGKGQAMTTWQKWNFDDKKTHQIREAILAQNRAGEKYVQERFRKNFSTWLNDQGWHDIIPSNIDAPKENKVNLCCKPECVNKVLIKYTLCKKCEAEYTAEARTAAKEFCRSLGLETRESMREWARKTLRAKFNGMIKHG
jgi:hypothetical protein